MTIFLLIRHAENDYVKEGRLPGRLSGVHLNEKGSRQAQLLAEKLAGAPVKALYSSPMDRAVETAGPLAKALGLEVVFRDGLTEVDCGEWAGALLKNLRRRKLWKPLQSSPAEFRFPGGETFAEAQRRIYVEIECLRARHTPKDMVICISHADPIRLLIAASICLPLDCFQRLSVAPASITALQVSEKGAHLLTMNYDPSFAFSRH